MCSSVSNTANIQCSNIELIEKRRNFSIYSDGFVTSV